MNNERIVILGAGPTGLGAAYRLQERGYKNFMIFEKNAYVGGLAASFKDSQGFTWDFGGHVLFSHYEYFDKLIDNILGKDYIEHERKAFVWVMKRGIPFPFQNNIHCLPFSKAVRCLYGLIQAKIQRKTSKNFKEWVFSTFGNGISEYFLAPFNSKLWTCPLEEMSYDWIEDRVSVVPLIRILGNIISARKDTTWGSNHYFKFPISGGTGEVFQRFVPYVRNQLFLNKEAVSIDIKKREVIFKDGQIEPYDVLINTMPLDVFIKRANLHSFFDAARKLKHNSVSVVGLGVKKQFPTDKSWIYFPENVYPFYRLTYISNFASRNTPQGTYFSLMCECAHSSYPLKNKEKIIQDVVDSLVNNNLLSKEDKDSIVSSYWMEAEYAYPIPTLDRDKVLETIQPYLEENNIYSRGRFGAWKYEMGTMDHSVMQGVEAVNKILSA